jgi:hypothetical protein
MGLVAIVAGTILNTVVSNKMVDFRKEVLIFSDKRAKSLAEYINGIR